jgi:transposase, IS30 family
MGVGERQRAVRAMRGQMWSPGRPSVARREDRVRFWQSIAAGVSSTDAAAVAGVSPAVGSRRFRDGGGMPPVSLVPLSGRYLSFAEREEIAILHAQRVGVRKIARRLNRSRVDDLEGAAPQRIDAQPCGRVSRDDRAVARRATRKPSEAFQARRQRRAARVRAGAARRYDRQV